MSDFKLAIGIPNTGLIKTQTVLSLMRALRNKPFEYDVFFKEGSILHWNRESIATSAIKGGFSHLLFVDTDMYFGHEAFVKILQSPYPITGVNCHARKLPLTSTLHIQKPKVVDGNYVKCDSVGAGFMLINTDVFKKIDHPWFFWEAMPDGSVKTGEDYWFCEKARKAGFEVWADMSISVKHIGDYQY